MEGVRWLTAATMDDGGSGDGGGGAPVVRGGGRVVGRVRVLEGRSGMESVELGDDRGEWDELGGAPGALQLRRQAVMLGRRLRSFLCDERMSKRCVTKRGFG